VELRNTRIFVQRGLTLSVALMYHILCLLRPRVSFTVDRVRKAHTIGKRPETGPTIIISTKRNLEIALQFPSTSAGIKLRVRYSLQFSGLTYSRVFEQTSPCTVSTAANTVFTVQGTCL